MGTIRKLEVEKIMLFLSKGTEKGQGLFEYAMILILVGIAVVVILGLIGDQVGDMLSDVNSGFDR